MLNSTLPLSSSNLPVLQELAQSKYPASLISTSMPHMRFLNYIHVGGYVQDSTHVFSIDDHTAHFTYRHVVFSS
jgi:hypothetical protein